MLDFNELWERLISVDESDTIEAKRGSAIGDSLLETISAFSNEPELGGGYILGSELKVMLKQFLLFQIVMSNKIFDGLFVKPIAF